MGRTNISNKAQSLREIADVAGPGCGEALLMLWDAKVEAVDDIDGELSGNMLKLADRALSVPNARAMQRIGYWSKPWGLNDTGSQLKLQEYSIQVGLNSRNLPKGSIKKLRKVLPTADAPVEPARGAQVRVEPLQRLKRDRLAVRFGAHARERRPLPSCASSRTLRSHRSRLPERDKPLQAWSGSIAVPR